MSLRPELKLDWCTHEAAKYAVEHWHYSKTMPRTRVAMIGAWEEGKFIGSVMFNRSACKDIGKPYGLTQLQTCELVRVALSRHSSQVTRIVAIAIRILKAQSPGLRLCVSFADPDQGHHGGIYQGGNWVYAGMTMASDEYIVNGKKYQGRALRATRNNRGSDTNVLEWARRTLDPKAITVKGSSKHRYLMPLDDEMRKQIEPLRKPYPKRVRSVDSDTSANHAEEGGANPTRTLTISSPASSGQHPDTVSDPVP